MLRRCQAASSTERGSTGGGDTAAPNPAEGVAPEGHTYPGDCARRSRGPAGRDEGDIRPVRPAPRRRTHRRNSAAPIRFRGRAGNGSGGRAGRASGRGQCHRLFRRARTRGAAVYRVVATNYRARELVRRSRASPSFQQGGARGNSDLSLGGAGGARLGVRPCVPLSRRPPTTACSRRAENMSRPPLQRRAPAACRDLPVGSRASGATDKTRGGAPSPVGSAPPRPAEQPSRADARRVAQQPERRPRGDGLADVPTKGCERLRVLSGSPSSVWIFPGLFDRSSRPRRPPGSSRPSSRRRSAPGAARPAGGRSLSLGDGLRALDRLEVAAPGGHLTGAAAGQGAGQPLRVAVSW